MAISEFCNLEIKGISCAVPTQKIDNTESYAQFGKAIVDKFIKTTGVKQRYVASEEQTTSDLCYVAAENLLEHLQWKRETIDALIFVTQSPDYKIPATACVLHKRLSLANHCIAFDVNLGCSSYPYGIFIAASFLQSSSIRRVLMLNGDITNVQDSNQATAMLFGAAGSATAIEKGNKTIRFMLQTDGTGYHHLIAPFGNARDIKCRKKFSLSLEHVEKFKDVYMDGAAIFDFALFDVTKSIQSFMQNFGTKSMDYDYLILHQANYMMIQSMAKMMKFSVDKVPISIDRYGNTSGCSLPVTLVDLCEKLDAPKRLNLLMTGFGVGLSWGIMDCAVDSACVLPMIYTNDYYKEAYRG